MTNFEFTAHDVQASYGAERTPDARDDESKPTPRPTSFVAHGITTEFSFSYEDPRHPLPPLSGFKLRWSIHASGGNAWAHYEDIVGWNREKITGREAEIKRVVGNRPFRGLFLRWEPEEKEVDLSYFLSADPAVVPLIMGIIAAKRSLQVSCMGFFFSNGRDDAAAPSASGFMHRREPLFTTDHPTLQVK
jgi:hypothetical protein